MATAIRQQQFVDNFSENLMNVYGGFLYPYGWAVRDGSGSGAVDSTKFFKGGLSLKITNSSSSNSIEIWTGTTDDLINLSAGTYFLSFAVYNPNANNITGKIRMFDALTEINDFTFDLEDVKNEWVTFVQKFVVASPIQMQLSYEIAGNGETGVVTYIDAVKIALDDKGNAFSDKYSFPKSTIPIQIKAEQSHTFGTIPSNDSGSFVMDVVGATVNDFVVLNAPLPSTHYGFSAYITDVDEVTIVCCNYGGGSVTLGSENFKVLIIK